MSHAAVKEKETVTRYEKLRGSEKIPSAASNDGRGKKKSPFGLKGLEKMDQAAEVLGYALKKFVLHKSVILQSLLVVKTR